MSVGIFALKLILDLEISDRWDKDKWPYYLHTIETTQKPNIYLYHIIAAFSNVEVLDREKHSYMLDVKFY